MMMVEVEVVVELDDLLVMVVEFVDVRL